MVNPTWNAQTLRLIKNSPRNHASMHGDGSLKPISDCRILWVMTYNDSLKILALAYDVKIAIWHLLNSNFMQYTVQVLQCYLAAHVTSLQVPNLKTCFDTFIFRLSSKSIKCHLTSPIQIQKPPSFRPPGYASPRCQGVPLGSLLPLARSSGIPPEEASWRSHHLLSTGRSTESSKPPRWEWKSSLYLGKKIAPQQMMVHCLIRVVKIFLLRAVCFLYLSCLNGFCWKMIMDSDDTPEPRMRSGGYAACLRLGGVATSTFCNYG